MSNFFKGVRLYNGLAILLSIALLAGCTPGTELLNRVPVHSVNFEVLDSNGEPLQGATVESSNGKSTSTDENGMATLRFGTVGVHNVTVSASDHLPTRMTVTLPTDNNELKTARLAQQVDYSGLTSGFAQMSGAQLYPMMFTYLFNSFGYNMELTDYKAGEWTKWRLVTEEDDEDDTLVMRKAFLNETDDGQQWWQIQLFEEDGTTASYTAEVLFDTNKSSIRRYREQIGDNDPQEKPVTENWYSQPNRLTQESIEGAIEERDVQIEVPDGTYSADLINFGVSPGVNLKIWRVLDVPGGTVQYSTEQEDEMVYKSQLVDYGTDADTILGSY
ncbi:carboxypeptidase regulatory-like domain-containing protein [Halalkalibaculum sp. DA3122]|uniref:carboxypeptidase regulatory-like domain-containing protein n=1 Tax=Halalkalibaculum sp. DA3122 TaxID=3373607 RepID=UPI0037547C0A